MSRRQTRKTVSMSAELHARLVAHCRRSGVPVAAWVDSVLTAALDAAGAPVVTRETALAQQRREGLGGVMLL